LHEHGISRGEDHSYSLICDFSSGGRVSHRLPSRDWGSTLESVVVHRTLCKFQNDRSGPAVAASHSLTRGADDATAMTLHKSCNPLRAAESSPQRRDVDRIGLKIFFEVYPYSRSCSAESLSPANVHTINPAAHLFRRLCFTTLIKSPLSSSP
jgi:hypothetical protein